MYNTVVLNMNRPDRAVIEQLAAHPVPSLYEVMGKGGILDVSIQPLFRPINLAGPALTVSCQPGDNLMLHKAMTLTQPGDVLVIDTGGAPGAVAGGIATVQSLVTGIAGVVTNGSARDVREIMEAQFPVFCQFVSPAGTSKNRGGSVNVPIVVGGVVIRPGDIIVGDDDGVVVVPPEAAVDVIEKAKARGKKEEALTEAARNSERLFDTLSLQKTYEDLAIREIEGPIDYWNV